MVDDDIQLLDVVANYLERDGCEVATATDGPAGLRIALETLPDLVVLDVMLPGLDGYDVCRRIREVAPIPVMMLTARTEEDDRLLGFDRGADDYLTKPFSPRELTARVKAILRRARGEVGVPGSGVVQIGDVRARPGEPRGHQGRATGLVERTGVRSARRSSRATRSGSSPGKTCSVPCGAGTSVTPRRSRCTCAACG